MYFGNITVFHKAAKNTLNKPEIQLLYPWRQSVVSPISINGGPLCERIVPSDLTGISHSIYEHSYLDITAEKTPDWTTAFSFLSISLM